MLLNLLKNLKFKHLVWAAIILYVMISQLQIRNAYKRGIKAQRQIQAFERKQDSLVYRIRNAEIKANEAKKNLDSIIGAYNSIDIRRPRLFPEQ